VSHRVEDSNGKGKRNSDDRFVFHERVLKDIRGLTKWALGVAGYIQHLRDTQKGDRFPVSISAAARWIGITRNEAREGLDLLIERDHLTLCQASDSAASRFEFGFRKADPVPIGGTGGVSHMEVHHNSEAPEVESKSKNSLSAQTRSTPMPDNFPTAEGIAFAAKHGITGDELEEAFRFFNETVHISANWEKAWRTYIVNHAQQFQTKNVVRFPRKRTNRLGEVFDRIDQIAEQAYSAKKYADNDRSADAVMWRYEQKKRAEEDELMRHRETVKRRA
jgi:hypothetical protein